MSILQPHGYGIILHSTVLLGKLTGMAQITEVTLDFTAEDSIFGDEDLVEMVYDLLRVVFFIVFAIWNVIG